MEPLVTPNFTDLDTGDPHLLGLEDHPRTIGYVVKNHGDPCRKLSFRVWDPKWRHCNMAYRGDPNIS